MDHAPFLTIGIASYNYSKYLKRAFDAIKAQTFRDFEILYCDDGSTDDSCELIESFIRQNPLMSIRLIRGKNVGVMKNKNRILDNARGKYVMLCDADDWMESNCLSLLCEKAIQTDADQIVGSFQNVDEDYRVRQIQYVAPRQSRWTWTVHHATLYKMSIVRKYNLRINPECYPDDVYFNTIFHYYSRNQACVNDIVYNWYTHFDSTSSLQTDLTSWHGEALLRSILDCIMSVYNKTKETNEEFEIEYLAAKIYGLAIYHRNAKTQFSRFWSEYTQCRKIMNADFPNWKENKYVKVINGAGLIRKRTAGIIYITSVLERFHLMRWAMWGYWTISQFYSFGI